MGFDGSGTVRRVNQQQHNRLKTWAERRPSVALMGEFSAGKSTLMNFLIEEDLLPTRATATELPPVWLTFGRRKAHWVDCDGGAHALDLAQIRAVPMTSRFIRIHATAEILEHCDIIDTPGISDPNLAVESWRYVAGQANMVLWCTSATQAWRETERSAWLSLPARLRRNSILVVTRADKLLTESDRDKVRRRLARETEGMFASIVFMATHDAVQAKAELAGDAETPRWIDSGAAALLDALAERFEAIYGERNMLMRRYRIAGEPDPEDAAMVQARRASDVLATQSSRAQAKHGSGGPYVLEAGAFTDGISPMPSRPARPQGGTARPARPDADARAGMMEQLQAGLGAAVAPMPDDWAGAPAAGADEDAPPAAEAAAPAAAWDAGEDLHAEATAEDRAGEDAGAETHEDDEAGLDRPNASEAQDDAPAADAAAEAVDDAPDEDAPDEGAAFEDAAFEDAAGPDMPAEADAADAAGAAQDMADDDLSPVAEADLPDAAPDGDDAETGASWPGDAAGLRAAAEADAAPEEPPAAGVADGFDEEFAGGEAAEPSGARAEIETEAEVPAEIETAAEPEREAEAGPQVEAPVAADAPMPDGRLAANAAAPATVPVVASMAASALPREVALWREVVARHPEVAAQAPLLALIEEFLAELHGRPAGDQTDAAPAVSGESGASTWRRLA